MCIAIHYDRVNNLQVVPPVLIIHLNVGWIQNNKNNFFLNVNFTTQTGNSLENKYVTAWILNRYVYCLQILP